jgi:hypothetical protein
VTIPDAGGADTFCLQTLDNCGVGSIDLQTAYEVGNTILATNAQGDIDLTVSEATNLSVDITGTGSFLVQNAGSTVLEVDDGRNINYSASNSGGLTVTSSLSAADRTTSAFSITQANDATYNMTAGNLLTISQLDTGTASPAVLIDNDSTTAGGYALSITNANTTTTGAAINITGVAGANVRGILIGGITTGMGLSNTATTTGSGINLGGAVTTGNGILFNTTGNGLTSGKALNVTGAATAITADFTGAYINVTPTRTMTAAATRTESGNFLNLARSNTTNGASSIMNITGDLATLSSNCTQTQGTCTDTSNILQLTQSYAAASGEVLRVDGAGTGNLATFDATNSSASGVLIDIASSSSAQYGLRVTTNNGGNTALSINGDGSISAGVAGTTTTVNGNLTVAGAQFTNNGATLNTATAISDLASGGAIGTAAATVDVYTVFNINQTTASQTLSLPTPTVTTAGRLVYVNNVGSASFTMYDSVIAAGRSNAFIWNGTAWVTSVSLSGSVVNTIGTIDSQTKSADGAVISSNAIYLQTADLTNPGLVSTSAQSFNGIKTFDDGLVVTTGGATISSGNLALTAGDLTTNGTVRLSNAGALQNITGYTQTSGALAFSGGGNFSIDSAAFDVTTAGAVSGVTTLSTSGIITVGTLGTADTDTLLCRNSSNQISTCSSTFDSSVTLQDAYQNGNTITATNAEGDIDLTVSEATNFSVDITGTGSFLVQDSGTAVLTVADGGATTFQNTSDSTSGFRVLDADGGTPIFNIDTTNERVGIGTATPTQALQVVGNAQFSGNIAVGPSNSVGSCGTYGDCGAMFSAVRTSTSTSDDIQIGTYNEVTLNPASTPATTLFYGIAGAFTSIIQSGNATDITSAIAGSIGQVSHNGTGTLSTVQGAIGNVSNTSTGTITSAVGIQSSLSNTSTGTITTAYGANIAIANDGGGTITTATGLRVVSSNSATGTITTNNGIDVASTTNAGGTITTNTGIRVRSQTVGDTNYGIRIDGVEDGGPGFSRALLLAGTSGGVRDGIGFGTLEGTVLYRTGNMALRTTASFRVDGLLQGDAGATVSGAAINLNNNSNFNTNINTGTSTGAVSIGNNTGNTAITVDSGTSAINIGTGAQARTVNVATGAAAQTLTLGSTSSTSVVNIQGGTGTASGDINIGDTSVNGTIVDIGVVSNTANGTVRIATSTLGSQTVTLGSSGGTSTTTINGGTGGVTIQSQDDINIGTNAVAQVITVGNTTGATSVNLTSGSAGVNINASNNQATNINTGTSTGAVSIGNSAAGAIALQSGSTISLTGATNINTSGTANTAIGNATGTLALTSSGLNVTTAGAVSGVSTLATSGIITVGAVGAASNDTVLCRNGSNQIASCNSTFLTSANAFIQGGNSFAATAVLGTNDNYGLELETNGTTRIAVTNAGATTITGGTTGNPDTLTVNNSTSTGNILNLQDNGTNVLTVADGGAATFQNTTNSTSALRVLNAAGDSVLNVDTTNKRVGIGLDPDNLVNTLEILGTTALAGTGVQTLTGSIDPDGTTTVTGVGTLFTKEIRVGDRITVSGETRTVSQHIKRHKPYG